MDQDVLRAMMPISFGKTQRKGATVQHSRPSTPPEPFSAPVALKRSAPQDDDHDDDGLTSQERAANKAALAQGDDQDSDQDGSVDLGPEPSTGPGALSDTMPMSHQAILDDHKKTVSALAIDSVGARFATGSYDYDLKLWDFGGMNADLKPFRSWEPCGNYPIHDLAWSATAEHLLCISGTSQPQVFDRDGAEVATYRKGDPYIRDMRTTNGHIAELSSGGWHPAERGTFMTASADSTVRLWDVEDKTKQKTVIVVRSKERGTRTKITAAKFNHDGRILAAAGMDGALHYWDTRASYASRPRGTIDNAHERNTTTSCIAFSKDGHTMATRGGDETVKLWDTRMFKNPLAIRGGLPNTSSKTDVIFSLDERSILTGVSSVPLGGSAPISTDQEGEAEKGPMSGGKIALLSRSDLSLERSFSISSSSVVRLEWHSKINQIFASTRSGAVHIFYSPTSSSRGALLAVDKKGRARNPFNADESALSAPIDPSEVTYQSESSKRRKMEKIRKDAKASKMPELPHAGPGKGGRIGAAATQHMVQSIWTDNSRSEDPREALLKYADKAKSDPKWTRVWKETQPDTIYSNEQEEE